MYYSPVRIPAIFAVFEGARRLAHDVGADRDRHVAESLIHLRHLCAKAVAALVDGRLYVFRAECVYARRGKARRPRVSGPAGADAIKPVLLAAAVAVASTR